MPPMTVMVKPVSGNCNMRCSYCFYADEAAHRDVASYGAMTLETLEVLVRRIFAYADGGVTLAFQGGEPTLAGAAYFERLLELERKYNSRRLPVQHALQTNGLRLSPELIAVLRKGAFLVGVSLDGCEEIHDSRRMDQEGRPTYARVLQTLQTLQKEEIEYNILCVVDREIARQPERCFNALKEHRFLQFIPCLDGLDGQATENSLTAEDYGEFLIKTFDLYEQTLRAGSFVSVRTLDNWVSMLLGHAPEACGMRGECSLGYLVESNGNVYPCDFYALDEWKLGNVHDQNFLRLSRCDNAKRFVLSSRHIDDACKSCRFAWLCRGGCRREREPFVDGRPGPNRLCAGMRRFFDERFDRLEALARWMPTAPHIADHE